MSHQQELFFAVKDYLDSQKWRYDEDREEYSFSYSMSLSSKLSSCRMTVFARENGIRFLAISPLKAKDDAIANVVEFITRANYGLTAGNFELDYSDGEIRYKNYIRSVTTIPTREEIEFMNDVCFMMFRRYGDGLVKNLMGFGNPEADIREIESN